jgi:hypothetical protein
MTLVELCFLIMINYREDVGRITPENEKLHFFSDSYKQQPIQSSKFKPEGHLLLSKAT